MTTQTTTAPVLATTAVIFLGLRAPKYHDAKDTQAVFAKLTPDQLAQYTANGVLAEPTEAELLRYPNDLPKALSWCEPGAVFEVTLDGSSIRYKTKQHPVLTPKHDNSLVKEWSAIHRATKLAMEAAKRAEKDSKLSAWKSGMDPVRDAYRKLNGPQRAQLIADLINYITH